MKKFIYLVTLFIMAYPSFSQDVSIGFSVHHEMMYNDFLDTTTNVPFLDVTYTNRTDQDIFINGICNLESSYPHFIATNMLNIPFEVYSSPDYHKIMAFNHPIYDENFIVEIDDIWTVLDSTQIDIDEISLHFVNDDLSHMYYWKELVDIKKLGIAHAESVLFAINNKNGLNLVFLKAGASFSSSYNLIALYINKGKYLFRVSPAYSANSIKERCRNMTDNQSISMELQLPDTIMHYNRYDGEIETKEFLLDMK